MSIKFEQPVQAVVAVAAVVIGADGVGSLEERNALFGKVKNLDVFKGVSEGDFRKLLNDTTDRLYGALQTEDGVLTGQAVDEIAAAAKAVLTPQQCTVCHQMALMLAAADGQEQTEQSLLDQLRRGLGV
jgi:tellurite resistance protein